MLYDPKWETKIDPISLDSLIAWLEKQPAEREYDYCDPFACLIGQWLRASGAANYALRSAEVESLFRGCGRLIVHPHPRTFGAALVRARALRTS